MYRDSIKVGARLIRGIWRRFVQPGPKDPALAYDMWSATYDDENENLLVLLDERMLAELICRVHVRGKRVIDVGCGTGRHWKRILAGGPAELVGYDVSAGMLAQLTRRFPRATVHLADAHALTPTVTQSCDLIVSTLALSHFRDAAAVFGEWARVLRVGGEILLTDFHPAAAASAETTFFHNKQVIRVKKYIRSIATLEAIARANGFECMSFKEIVVDESMRSNYTRALMGGVFERMKGMPLLYGMHLCKRPPGCAF